METDLHPDARRMRRKRGDHSVYVGLAGFRYALRKFLAFSDVAVNSAGVTAQQYQAMLALAASPEGALTMKQLAEEMLLKPNGAVQLVDRLEVADLVQRAASSTDRRGVLLALTPTGRGVIKVLAKEHQRELLKHGDLLLDSLRRLQEINDHASADAGL